MTLDLRVLDGPRQPDRADRVEVADEQVGVEPGGAGVVEPAVGGHDVGTGWHGGDRTRVQGGRAGDHHDAHRGVRWR